MIKKEADYARERFIGFICLLLLTRNSDISKHYITPSMCKQFTHTESLNLHNHLMM